ncbi:RsiV family protein [Mycobacterium sp. NPDC048908]|uniref:RsiV family protein n=1 Tax=Mycobacterium sp. NPDC048908 TaxID=3364292 RepID=UPI003714AE21
MLNTIVQRELAKHSDVPVRDDLDATTYRNFAITDDAVIFFFAEDEVVADNNGPHQISVPRSELASMLA